jgi:hypothetical protein
MISGPFIDQDMNYSDVNIAYVLTELCLYKCTDLQAGVPISWAIVLAGVSYPELVSIKFSRVRSRDNHVYVMGYANPGTTTADIVVFHSEDSGSTWAYSTIPGANMSMKPYTVVTSSYIYNRLAGVWATPYTMTIPRITDPANVCSPWAMAYTFECVQLSGYPPIYTPPSCWVEVTGLDGGASPYYATAVRGTNPEVSPTGFANNLLGWNFAGAEAFLTDYFCSWTRAINGSVNMPKEDTRQEVDINFGGSGFGYPAQPSKTLVTVFVFYNIPSQIVPRGFDIGKHSPLKVYVGTKDRVYKSSDGAAHFIEHLTYDGANDIECHMAQPAADDEITFWSATTGELIRTFNGGIAGVYGGVLDLIPSSVPYRIASDPINGFPIWVLEHQCENKFKLRKSVDGVVWSDITINGTTDLYSAKSLKEYAMVGTLQRRIILLTNSGIWYSTDEATFTNKLGNYPADDYLPVVANLW